MRTILRSNIIIGERVRTINEDHAQALADDIIKNGLIQPPVIKTVADPLLVVGGHRNRAIAILAERGITQYRYDNMLIHIDKLVVLTVGDLTAEQLLEVEIAENVIRLELDWRDRNNALARLHEGLAKRANEKPQDFSPVATGKIIAQAGDTRNAKTIEQEVARSVIIAAHMDNPAIAAAKSLNEAWTLLRKQTIADHQRVISAVLADMPTKTRHTFIKGDFEHNDEAFRNIDLILSDPPYGVGADTWTSKFEDEPHKYDDSYKNAYDTWVKILNSSFTRWTSDRANLFMCCAPEHWHTIRDLAEAAGWTTWPHPVIWHKANEGIRPWGISGFAYAHEAILFATKGQKGLLRSVIDVIEIYKVGRYGRLHGAQKPVELFKFLIEIAAQPGDTIADPTCGSGTIFEAAQLTNTTAIGAERNEEYWPVVEERIASLITPVNPQIELEDLLAEHPSHEHEDNNA